MIAVSRPQRSQTSFTEKDVVDSGLVPSQDTSSYGASALPNESRYLLVSPYDEQDHLLDLQTVDIANQLLAKALVSMQCLREDYATAPYIDNFNWQEVVNTVQQLSTATKYTWKEQSFYIVVFRSQIPPTTVYGDLGVLDKAAHAEATRSGGFLK